MDVPFGPEVKFIVVQQFYSLTPGVSTSFKERKVHLMSLPGPTGETESSISAYSPDCSHRGTPRLRKRGNN